MRAGVLDHGAVVLRVYGRGDGVVARPRHAVDGAVGESTHRYLLNSPFVLVCCLPVRRHIEALVTKLPDTVNVEDVLWRRVINRRIQDLAVALARATRARFQKTIKFITTRPVAIIVPAFQSVTL